jgi:signal transduction histidine kinase
MLMADVLKKPIRDLALLASDFQSFRRQESIFVTLNLFVLAALLLIHTLFSSVFGTPPPLLIVVLSIGFLINVVELIWLQGAQPLSAGGTVVLTCASIALNMTLAFTLASLSYRQDIQYFTLLVAPILQAAFRFSSGVTITVVAVSTTLVFYWAWNYFRTHPPAQIVEYVEDATIALIFAIVGILVWMLVNQLRSKEADLSHSLKELEQTRERLLIEEKLAAVGRLSSAIAHEIRNPVAIISGALANAFSAGTGSAERDEMFAIAAKEASRLEKMTRDFLTYAKPRAPAKQSADLAESIAYMVDICQPHAIRKAITIRAEVADELRADFDSGQLQQALLNLMMNAIEASPAGGAVVLRGTREPRAITVQVENANGPIPQDVVGRVFEPFFTTKSAGTGLGLAIARNIVRGHGGELVLSRNESDVVQFAISIPASTQNGEGA